MFIPSVILPCTCGCGSQALVSTFASDFLRRLGLVPQAIFSSRASKAFYLLPGGRLWLFDLSADEWRS